MSDRILILGASARAAAASARRAGLTPFAVDLFADRDTRLLCEWVERCPFAEYPRGLFDRARRFPPMPWMYTGGLENYPDLVGELARDRELWGNGPDVLSLVRDPYFLDRLPKHVAGFAEVVVPNVDAVRKPLRGSGGGGVRRAEPGDSPHPDFFYQEFIEGEPRSAVFATTAAGHLVAFGVTTQLIGPRWLHVSGFQYAGSISRPGVEPLVNGWAGELVAATGLRGVFGLDYIGDGGHVVDVNPRYVASVEVLELATGASLLRCTERPPPATRAVGKAIYFTPARLAFPESGPWDESLVHAADVWRRPDFADLPHPGEVIEPGQPVLTILTDAATEAECRGKLKVRAAELDRLFGFPTPEDDPC